MVEISPKSAADIKNYLIESPYISLKRNEIIEIVTNLVCKYIYYSAEE